MSIYFGCFTAPMSLQFLYIFPPSAKFVASSFLNSGLLTDIKKITLPHFSVSCTLTTTLKPSYK